MFAVPTLLTQSDVRHFYHRDYMPVLSTRSKPVSPVALRGDTCHLSGDWNVQALAKRKEVVTRQRALVKAKASPAWDLSKVGLLDAVGAQLIWEGWGQQLPKQLTANDDQKGLFAVVAANPIVAPPPSPRMDWLDWVREIGAAFFVAFENGRELLVLLGNLVLNLWSLLLKPRYGPWREISAQVFRTGTQAVAITALVGFLIGIVLSYLSAQQLNAFGAGQYVIKLLGVSIVRELGPVLAAIIVAGRSGSAITAQIGVMRVTQELDAMDVMGISQSQRLILPRVVALAITMPLLIIWTDTLALLGGVLAANFELGLSTNWSLQRLPDAIGITNFWIGNLKGVTFGIWIALVACHFGLQIEPNTESLGRGTTTSVVTSITGVILIDALYAIIINELKL